MFLLIQTWSSYPPNALENWACLKEPQPIEKRQEQGRTALMLADSDYSNSISPSKSSCSSHEDGSSLMSSVRPSWKQVNNAAEFQTLSAAKVQKRTVYSVTVPGPRRRD